MCYRSRTALLVVLLSVPGGAAWAQVEVEPDQSYLLLSTTRTSTMQTELDEAAARGFRIVTGSPTSSEITILLARVTEPPDTYQYRLLAASRVSTLQREIDEAAAQGFRLLPGTLMLKSASGFFGGSEIVAVLEREPGVNHDYEYTLLATSFTSTLQRELTEATEAGFVVAALSGGRDDIEHIVVMEREAR